MASTDNPRLILALKIRALRRRRGETLQAVAARAGQSVSYLSEIEKGKKYPKPERLLRLAEALGVPFDELVSLKLTEELTPLGTAFSSPLLSEFPFELFGLESQDLMALVSGDPERGSALLRAVVEVGLSYDVHVEHFLLAALRAYQQLHSNYFEQLEIAASAFRRKLGLSAEDRVEEDHLAAALRRRWSVELDERRIPRSQRLSRFRSVSKTSPPVLCVNPRLLPSQKAFVLAREIAFLHLELGARAATSPWLEVTSFDQVLNNFKASYFAGALIMDRRRLRGDLETLFCQNSWDMASVLGLMESYGVTPETLLHRLTQIAPHFFGLGSYYFLRFNAASSAPSERVKLTKWLNTTSVPVPRGFGLSEHFCRRWPALRLLVAAGSGLSGAADRLVAARTVTFVDERKTFLEISMARQMALQPEITSAVSVGFELDRRARGVLRFSDDPLLPHAEVNLTCERCGLDQCSERVAPATIRAFERERARTARAVERIVKDE